MNKRELLKWTTPLVAAVVLPSHAFCTGNICFDPSCSQFAGESGPIKAYTTTDGPGHPDTLNVTSGSSSVDFDMTEVERGTTKDGFTVKGTFFYDDDPPFKYICPTGFNLVVIFEGVSYTIEMKTH